MANAAPALAIDPAQQADQARLDFEQKNERYEAAVREERTSKIFSIFVLGIGPFLTLGMVVVAGLGMKGVVSPLIMGCVNLGTITYFLVIITATGLAKHEEFPKRWQVMVALALAVLLFSTFVLANVFGIMGRLSGVTVGALTVCTPLVWVFGCSPCWSVGGAVAFHERLNAEERERELRLGEARAAWSHYAPLRDAEAKRAVTAGVLQERNAALAELKGLYKKYMVSRCSDNNSIAQFNEKQEAFQKRFGEEAGALINRMMAEVLAEVQAPAPARDEKV